MYAYSLGKLYQAVAILTTHPEDARSRLRACWTPFTLAGIRVPEHLQEEYKAIRDELTKRKYQPPDWEPETDYKWKMWIEGVGWMEADHVYAKMVHTTKTMRKATASRLAGRIMSLALCWKDWLGDGEE